MQRTVFIGTYTHGASEGIYSCRFDSETGSLDGLRIAAATESPSFLALHPNGKFLYAVNETQEFGNEESGSVTAYKITDPAKGELRKLNTVSSHGASPCHLAVSPGGKSVIVANYHGGTVSVIKIDGDGSLGEMLNVVAHGGSGVNKSRQEAPHPHSINIDPAGKFVFVADLGIDKIVRYALRTNGSLSDQTGATEVAAGSGPRHFAFHPSGKFGYVINELSRTITAFRYDGDDFGQLSEIQTISTVPNGWDEGSTAEIVVHPSGAYLYGSNRGHDSIACYRIDAESGKLALIEIEMTGGETPRSFGIDPEGKFLIAANQSTSDLHVFTISRDGGDLEPAAGRLEVPAPVCVVFSS